MSRNEAGVASCIRIFRAMWRAFERREEKESLFDAGASIRHPQQPPRPVPLSFSRWLFFSPKS